MMRKAIEDRWQRPAEEDERERKIVSNQEQQKFGNYRPMLVLLGNGSPARQRLRLFRRGAKSSQLALDDAGQAVQVSSGEVGGFRSISSIPSSRAPPGGLHPQSLLLLLLLLLLLPSRGVPAPLRMPHAAALFMRLQAVGVRT
jgi:hypothetical protein